MKESLTLVGLCGDEVLDEGVGRLRVQRQRVLQRLEVLALVDVAHLEADAGSVEVHLDHLQGLLHDSALFR